MTNAAAGHYGDMVEGIACAERQPRRRRRFTIVGDVILAPGFVDLQVNGGGGVMLNDHPDVQGIETICRAHAPFGTTALLPTLITDTPEVTAAAVAAGIEAARQEGAGLRRAASRRAASLASPARARTTRS